MFIVSAMIFITYFNLRSESLFLDLTVLSILFIIINLVSSYNLFKKLIPPSFSSEEKRLFNRYFSRYFKPNEYRRLLDAARRRVYKINSTVINQGNEFNSILFIANISTEEVVVCLRQNGTITKSLTPNSWIGLIEYVDYISSKPADRESISWGVDVQIKINENASVSEDMDKTFSEEESFTSESHKDEEGEQLSYSSISKVANQVVIYEWDLFVRII
jgi:hypothetical protein